MAVTLFMVRATITKDKDAAFNRWYNEEHVPQVLQFNGAVSARRYKKILGEDKFDYMTLYEFASEEVSFCRFLDLGPPQNPEQGLRRQFWRGLGPATCRLPEIFPGRRNTRAARPKRKAGHRCGVGALPSKPRKGTQGYQGGAHARRVLSVPLRRQENVEPQARFHRHLQFIHRYGHGTSLTAAPVDLAGPRRKAASCRRRWKIANISREGGRCKGHGL